jgi:hypothetical protein
MPEPFVICGEGRIIIRRSPKDIFEFVLDVDRYRQADLKIGRVHYVKRTGNLGEVRHDGRLMGIKAPPVVLAFTLTPYSRLEFRGLKVPWPLLGFDGFFTCDETPQGTLVAHRECFILGPVSGRLFKLLLGWWLRRDTPAEVLRMKRLLEREAPA